MWFDLRHEERFDAKGAIQYHPEGDATRVTWTEAGDVGGSLFARLLVPFLDAALGGDFERGLARLAALAEAPPAGAPLEDGAGEDGSGEDGAVEDPADAR